VNINKNTSVKGVLAKRLFFMCSPERQMSWNKPKNTMGAQTINNENRDYTLRQQEDSHIKNGQSEKKQCVKMSIINNSQHVIHLTFFR